MNEGRDIDELDARLQRIHLSEVDADREAMHSLRVEQARLVLYGSIAIAGGALTAVWAADRTPCLPFFKAGLFFLAVGAFVAWQSLQWEGTHRALKIVAAYAALSESRAKTFGPEQIPGPTPGSVDAALRRQMRAATLCIWLNTAAFALAIVGATFLINGTLDTVSGVSCRVFLFWPLSGWN